MAKEKIQSFCKGKVSIKWERMERAEDIEVVF